MLPSEALEDSLPARRGVGRGGAPLDHFRAAASSRAGHPLVEFPTRSSRARDATYLLTFRRSILVRPQLDWRDTTRVARIERTVERTVCHEAVLCGKLLLRSRARRQRQWPDRRAYACRHRGRPRDDAAPRVGLTVAGVAGLHLDLATSGCIARSCARRARRQRRGTMPTSLPPPRQGRSGHTRSRRALPEPDAARCGVARSRPRR